MNEQKQVSVREQSVSFMVNGYEVKLSPEIVRKYLTNGNAAVTDQEVVMFINLCKFHKLNPFLKEAYLIKFGTQPASIIISKEVFFKRAEANPMYDGTEAGIIVKRGAEYHFLEGAFMEDTDVLAGGWARVYRKDRKYSTYSSVRLSEYDKGQSIWKEKKATMISKVAKVQALREAFPVELGAMYTDDEMGVSVDKIKPTPKHIDFNEAEEVQSTPKELAEPQSVTITSEVPAEQTTINDEPEY
jgi:phage recombination protein Bet